MHRRHILLLGFVISGVGRARRSQAQPSNHPFAPVGRWRFFHTDGKPFQAQLLADGTARTDWEGGEQGIWRWEGNAVRILYTDGWDDLLSLDVAGRAFVKRGWAPGADRCGPPSNEAKAERLSDDAGPPLGMR